MNDIKVSRIALDYGAAGDADLLDNLSGVAFDAGFLWTVSDEGRTLECLKAEGEGFVLFRQVLIDTLIIGLPGAEDAAELDLESLDLVDGVLWLCGSHCNVRKTPAVAGEISAKIRSRPSRHFLARINIKKDGATLGKVMLAPVKGPRALRRVLAGDPYLAPFLDLPSKENGLDIEGLAVTKGEVLLGLRGPILDNMAVVAHLKLDANLAVKTHRLSFLDLGGLAIRDLCRSAEAILIVAGPVGDALGPFRLYRWKPDVTSAVQHPREVYAWPTGTEKPEGLCAFEYQGKPGHLVVYDRPDQARVQDGVYTADWLPIA